MGVDQAKLPRSVSRQLPASSETNGNKNRKSEICESERKVFGEWWKPQALAIRVP